MITRERLERTTYGQGLLKLYESLTPYFVRDWGNDDSDDKDSNRPSDREQVSSLHQANVMTSLRESDDILQDDKAHALVIDIDHPSWLIPSTTPGHYHLYVDVSIDDSQYWRLVEALAESGVVERGYYGASKARGFTSVRLPWVEKVKGKVPD